MAGYEQGGEQDQRPHVQRKEMEFSRQEYWSGLSFPSPKMEVLNFK